LEADLEVVAQVRALLRPGAPASAAEQIPEAEDVAEAAEDVLEADEGRRIEPGAALRAEARVTEAIVGRALLRVRQHGVGLRRFLELLFGVLAALITIRMMQQRELPVGGLQIRLGAVTLDAEDFVVVATRHACATLTIAGRSRRSPSM